MKNIFILFLFLFPFILSAQKNIIKVTDQEVGNSIVLTGKNKSKTDQQVDVKVTSQGFGLAKEKTVTVIVPAKSEKELIRLVREPSKKWSYSYTVSYKPCLGEAMAAKTETTPATTSDEAKPENRKITVFTKKGCGRCATTVSYLKDFNIDFEEKDITKSKKNNELLSEKLFASGFQGGSFTTPVVMVGEEVFYNIENLQTFLAKLSEGK